MINRRKRDEKNCKNNATLYLGLPKISFAAFFWSTEYLKKVKLNF